MTRSTATMTGARNAIVQISALICALLLSGCGFVHDEKLVARYRLVAVDTEDDLMLCWDLDGGSCVGDGLGGSTLFAAGYNDKYVVEAIHPGADKSRAIYYYIVRDPKNEDKDHGMPYAGVTGPLSREKYESEKMRLGLPEFTRVFEDLK